MQAWVRFVEVAVQPVPPTLAEPARGSHRRPPSVLLGRVKEPEQVVNRAIVGRNAATAPWSSLPANRWQEAGVRRRRPAVRVPVRKPAGGLW